MTTRTRSVPLDMLSVEHKGARIAISTHRQSLHVLIARGAAVKGEDFTFDELYAALAKIVEEKGK